MTKITKRNNGAQTNFSYEKIVENTVKRLIKEGLYDDDEEIDPFEEYTKDYPNGDFDASDMTTERLAKWCQNVGDFLYIFKGLRGWTISAANTKKIVYEIIDDLHKCRGIEPTHEMDWLFSYNREREFVNDYVCVFKVKGTPDGDYYIVYQQPKNGGSYDFDESYKRKTKILTENYKNRRQVSRNEIIDILNASDDFNSNNGKFVSVTYVKPVSVYKMKKKWRSQDVKDALDLHKEKSGEDWYKKLSDFNQEGAKGKNPISAVVVTQRYLLHWTSQDKFRRDYANYANKLSDLRMRNGIGLDSDGKLGFNHNQRQQSNTGIQFNQTNKLSRDFNIAGSKVKTTAYFVDETGHIVTELPSEVLDSMRALKKSYAPEKAVSQILSGPSLEAYIKAKAELDKSFRPKNLLFDRILCIAANVNGESYYYINDKLASPITDKSEVNVSPSEMIKIAEDQLSETFSEI